MGKVAKKNKKEDKKGGKIARLLGRGQKGTVVIDQPDYPADAQEAYRAIGRVNPEHLQDCQSWDVKYLGCVRSVRDWQSPGSRTEFMELVDQGQASGFLMLHSFTPKQLHISPRRMIITDDKRKVSYAEVPLTSVGSLAYAEDDNRHFLGIKTLGMGAGEGREGGEEEDQGSYCCHVLECDKELLVRQICSGMSEHFQQLLAQQEARRRQQQAAADAAAPQQPVPSKMLKKLSEQTASPPKADQPQGKPEKASTKPSEEVKKPSEKVRKLPEKSKQPPPQAKPAKKKAAKSPKESKPSPRKQQSQTQPVLAGMEVGLEDSEFGFIDFKPGISGVEPGLPLEPLDQEWILRDWSTHLHSPTSQQGEILDEIGRQFSAISQAPVRARRPGSQMQGPKLKRLSIHEGDKGSLSKRQRKRGVSSRVSPRAKADLNQSSQLLPPLKPDQAVHHDGKVITQKLEDATGVKVPDSPELLVTKSKTRLSIRSLSDGFSASPSQHALDQMETNEPPPEPADISPGKSLERKGSNRSRRSYLLDTMEGDKETRIDGDGSGAILVQTVMSEKETCIVGGQGQAMLLPVKELGDYEREQQELDMQEKKGGAPTSATTSPTPPPPPASAPPPPPASAPPPPPARAPFPPTITKKQREPWPVLVRVDDVPRDPAHKSYLHEVCCTMGVIEYRKLRQDWLAYQRCNIDVVAFCKRTKLLFRGDRVHLREGARVLVDLEDQPVFDDVLAGKVVESQPPSSRAPPPLTPASAGTSMATPPSRPWSATKSAKPSVPAASTSAPPLPASSTGGLSSKLQMFEKPASSTSSFKPVEIEGGISVRKLIQASEGTGAVSESKPMVDIGRSEMLVKPSSVKKFGELDGKDQESPSSSRAKPSRGGILSKIAAFQGGGVRTPPSSPEPQRGREQERERDRDRRGDRKEERREGRRSERKKPDSRSDDSKKHGDRRKDRGGRERSGDRKGREEGRRREEDDARGDEKERRRSRKEKDRERHRSRKHRSESEERRQRRQERRKHSQEESGLDSILAAGNELLGPLRVNTKGTIDALSNLLGNQADEGDDILEQAAKVIGAFDYDSSTPTQSTPQGYVPPPPAPPPQPFIQQVPVTSPAIVPVPMQQAMFQQPVVVQQPIVVPPQQQAVQPAQFIAFPQQGTVIQQPIMQVQQPVMQVQQGQPLMQVLQPPTTEGAAAIPGTTQAMMPTGEPQQGQAIPPQPEFGSYQPEGAGHGEQHHVVAQGYQEESEESGSESESNSEVEAPAQGQGLPPPPPPPGMNFVPQPPPLQEQVPPPKLPHSQTSSSDVHATRDTMLDEIRRGKQLKPVAVEEKSSSDQEGDLLAEIRSGRQLKKVEEHEKSVTTKEKGEFAKAITEEWKRQNERQQRRDRGGREDEREERHGKHHKHERSEMEERHARDEDRRGRSSRDADRHGRSSRDEDRHGRSSRGEGEKRQHRSERRKREQRHTHEKEREGRRGRQPRDESPKSRSSTEEEEPPKPARSQPPAHQRRRDSRGDRYQGVPQAMEKDIPAWKAALMRKRQEREMGLQGGGAEEEPEPETEPAKKLAVETYQGIPQVNEDDESLPAWKAALFKKRRKQLTEEEETTLQKKAEEAALFEGMPDWKKKLMKQRLDAKASQEAAERELDRQMGEKKTQIMSMPEWKRKLFLERNPQYK